MRPHRLAQHIGRVNVRDASRIWRPHATTSHEAPDIGSARTSMPAPIPRAKRCGRTGPRHPPDSGPCIARKTKAASRRRPENRSAHATVRSPDARSSLHARGRPGAERRQPPNRCTRCMPRGRKDRDAPAADVAMPDRGRGASAHAAAARSRGPGLRPGAGRYALLAAAPSAGDRCLRGQPRRRVARSGCR